jgi:mycofactocin system creatininase family protein
VNPAERIVGQTPTIGAHQVNSAYHRRVDFPSALGNSTARQLRDLSPALIIPLGSTEQHGPHLPVDTDTRIASAVACAVAERLAGDWMLAPAIGYGASGEHQGFPGTVSIGTSVLQLLLVEYGRSACDWASRLVFVNGHGGNVAAVAAATSLLREEGRDVAWCACSVPGADAHAGHTETSVLLHISPEAVHTAEWVAGNQAPLADLMPQLRAGGVAAVSTVGVLGDPTTASAVEGARIFAEMVDSCSRCVAAWTPGHGGLLQ